jgi:hypothetical protein
MKSYSDLAPIIGIAALLSVAGVSITSAQTQATPPATQQEQQPQQSPAQSQPQQPSTGSGGMHMQGMEHGQGMQQRGMEHGRGMQGMGPGRMQKEQEKK